MPIEQCLIGHATKQIVHLNAVGPATEDTGETFHFMPAHRIIGIANLEQQKSKIGIHQGDRLSVQFQWRGPTAPKRGLRQEQLTSPPAARVAFL